MVAGSRNRDRGSVGSMRSAVCHGRRIEAKLNARFGTAIGRVGVGAVGSHGDGNFSRVVHAGAVGRATAGNSRDSRGDGGFAVHRR